MTPSTGPPPEPPPVDHRPPGLPDKAIDPDKQAIHPPAHQKKKKRTKIWAHNEEAPSWLVSFVLHGLVIVAFALLSLSRSEPVGITLFSTTGSPSDLELPFSILSDEQPDQEASTPAAEAPVSLSGVNLQNPVVPTPTNPPTPKAVSNELWNQVLDDLNASDEPSLIEASSGSFEGRSEPGRIKFGRKYGATPESEEAVEKALDWLVAHQRQNGGWSFQLNTFPCNGQCKNSGETNVGQPTPSTAATGLALLAFLGAGYTDRVGPHTETVKRGLYFLESRMRPATVGSDLRRGSMYGHGIASLAIIEAAAMTQDETLRDQARRLAYFILAARHRDRGWGYTPGTPGDVTLTGWQVMALLGAKRLKIPMPTDIFSSTQRFVDSLSPDNGLHFGYRDTKESASSTAIGLTLQMYFGRSPRSGPQKEGLDLLVQSDPKLTNVYHSYYSMLALHHARHPQWSKWHTRIRDHLIRTQATTGHEAGSWFFKDRHGKVGGRLYTTAMCAMILEVYYRYLPLYAETGLFDLESDPATRQ